MRRFCAALALWMLTSAATAFSDVIANATLRRVYDGDTIFVDIDNPEIPDVFRLGIGVRLRGIDTPEMRGKCPREVGLARHAKNRLLELLAGKTLVLKNVARDKYFRLLANVYVDGTNVVDVMLREQHGVPYEGGKKKDWCE